ncbi:MAG: hypothetical protein AAF720_13660 [Pseudomonadota bacterium]
MLDASRCKNKATSKSFSRQNMGRRTLLPLLCGSLLYGVALSACGGEEPGNAVSDVTAAAADAIALKKDSPIDTPFSLKGAQAVDLDAVLALIPEAVRPSYGSATFDEKRGAMVVTDLKFAPRVDVTLESGDASFQGAGLTAARAEIYGLDPDALKRIDEAVIEGQARYRADFEDVLVKMRLFDIEQATDTEQSATDEASQTAVGALEFDGLAIRLGAFGGVEEGVDANAAHFFNSFKLKGLYLKDISVASKDDSASSPSVRFSAPDVRYSGLGAGRLDAFVARNLKVTTAQSEETIKAARDSLGGVLKGPVGSVLSAGTQTYTFDVFNWQNIDFSKLMPFALAGDTPPTTERDLIDLGSIRVTGAETLINGKLFSRAEETSVSAIEATWLIPSRIDAKTPKITYDFTAYLGDNDTEALDVLTQNGLNNLTGSSNFLYQWNADSGDLSLATDFNAKDFTDLDFSMGLAGLQLEDLAKAPELQIEDVFSDLGLSSLNLVIDDEKMLDAIFAIAALQTGGDAGTVRSQGSALVRVGAMQAMLINPKLADYANAIASFMEKGGRLAVKAAPEAPVSFSKLNPGSVATLPQDLNLTVEHSE